MIFQLFTFACLLQAAVAFYERSDVIELTAKDFNKLVIKGDEVWIVEFYAPWCGHCQQLAPEYRKAAAALKGVVKVAAVDATAHESLAGQYQIQGFPTIKVFGADKKSPVDYQGERKAEALIAEGMKAVSKLVKDRQKGGSDKSSKSKGSSSGSGSGSKSHSGSDVIELNDVNFDALVLESNDIWLVEFFAPWCGHCKKLAPEWESAATELKGSVKLGAVDATANSALASKYGVKGYPTIKVFQAGKKGKATDYQGPREASGIVNYALELLEKSGVGPKITQLTSQSVFDDACGQTGKICAIMFVPHILDSQSAGRNEYLQTFTEVAKAFRGKPFNFIWSEGGAQSSLESATEVTFGYPALIVVSTEKNVYSVQRLSWSKKNIQAFLNGILSGTNKAIVKLDKVPKVVTVQEWDGKDAEIVTDEIPLDELMND